MPCASSWWLFNGRIPFHTRTARAQVELNSDGCGSGQGTTPHPPYLQEPIRHGTQKHFKVQGRLLEDKHKKWNAQIYDRLVNLPLKVPTDRLLHLPLKDDR